MAMTIHSTHGAKRKGSLETKERQVTNRYVTRAHCQKRIEEQPKKTSKQSAAISRD